MLWSELFFQPNISRFRAILAVVGIALLGVTAESSSGPTQNEVARVLRATHDFGGLLRADEVSGSVLDSAGAGLVASVQTSKPAETAIDSRTGESLVVMERVAFLTDRDGRLRIERRPLYLKGFEDSIVKVELWDEQGYFNGLLNGTVISRGGPFSRTNSSERQKLLEMGREPHDRMWAGQGYLAGVNFVIHVLESESDVGVTEEAEYTLVSSSSSRIRAKVERSTSRLVELAFTDPGELRLVYVFDDSSPKQPQHPSLVQRFRSVAGGPDEYLGESRFRNFRVDHQLSLAVFTTLKQSTSIIPVPKAIAPADPSNAASTSTRDPTNVAPEGQPAGGPAARPGGFSVLLLTTGIGFLVIGGIIAYWRRAR